MNKKLTPAELADMLGQVKSEIATLKEQETHLKDALVDTGVGAVEGNIFRATVSVSQVKRVDYAGLIKRLEPSKQMIRAYTNARDVTTVRVVARNGKE